MSTQHPRSHLGERMPGPSRRSSAKSQHTSSNNDVALNAVAAAESHQNPPTATTEGSVSKNTIVPDPVPVHSPSSSSVQSNASDFDQDSDYSISSSDDSESESLNSKQKRQKLDREQCAAPAPGKKDNEHSLVQASTRRTSNGTYSQESSQAVEQNSEAGALSNEKIDSNQEELTPSRVCQYISKTDKRARALKEDLEATQSQLDESREDLEATQSQLDKSQDDLEATKSQLDESQEDLEATQSQLDKSQEDLEATKSQLDKSKQQVLGQARRSQEELQTTTQQLQTTESQLQTTTQQLQTTESQLQTTTQQLQTTESQLQTTESQLTDANQRACELEIRVASLESRIRESDELFQRVVMQLIGHVPDTQPRWAVQRNEIELTDEILGRGGWAEVKVARFRGNRVAAKIMHATIMSDYNRTMFTREMEMASYARHPYLLQFIGATLDNEVPIILTELMQISLRRVLEIRTPLTQQHKLTISYHVALALNYLHLMHPEPIIHRDVSSANVLLEQQGRNWKAKLSDYGSANFVRRTSTNAPGNAMYAAPEAVDPQRHSPKMDVFSFGLLLQEIFSGEMPSIEDIHNRQRLAIRFPQVEAQIHLCIRPDPEERPAITEITSELARLIENT